MVLHTIGREYYPQYEFPLKVYRNLHRIPEIPLGKAYQIIIVEEGTGIIEVNKERKIIHAPVVFLINELERISSEESEQFIIHIIYFHPSVIHAELDFYSVRERIGKDYSDIKAFDLYLLNPFLLRDRIYADHYQLPQVMQRRLLYLKECISDECSDQNTCYWPCKGRAYFLEMLCYLSGINTEISHVIEAVLNTTNDLYERILLYVHVNFSEKITLHQLVEVFNVNQTTLNKMFKKITGESIISYLIKLRIKISLLLLRDTNLPVREIAYRVGYEDVVHYFRTFKKIMGDTPNQYREGHRTGIQPY
jgi:AraC family L-rhamnose operon regulatory protein RhaS